MKPLPMHHALTLLLIVPGLAPAHDDNHEPRPVPEAVAHRPTAIPDRIIRTFAGDPATVIAVNWRTDATVAKAVAQIAPAEAGPKFVTGAKEIAAKSAGLKSNLGEARYHSVVFDGLAANTLYAYRVGDGVNWSEWVHARTASDKPEPFSFVYFGDAQNDIKSLWSRVIRGAYSDAPKAKFIVHAGDLINRASADADWGEWFAAGGWVNAMVPSVPTPGNHEYERVEAPDAGATKGAPGATAKAGATAKGAPQAKAQTKSVLTRHWRPQFTLPENGPKGLEETAYYVDYQGVRIVSLNSNEKREAQASWLEKVLSDNPNAWTILTFHHPIYSTAKDRDNPELRSLWQPIFDKYRVDLVLQGHDHTYGRSGMLTYQNVSTGLNRRDGGGTVYVVSVSGPKMYNLQKSPWMVRSAEDTQLYQIISIDGGVLKYQARTAVGDIYDAFDLKKRAGQPNELVERVPATPERHRPPAAAPARAAARRAAN